MAAAPSTRSKLLLFIVLVHLLAFNPSACANEAEDEPIHFETVDVDGFHVDPNLIEETIDDSLRSRSEREEEAILSTSSTHSPFDHTCPYGYFACNTGGCIAPRWRCDGHYDCDDFSDELNCTAIDLPQRGSMAQNPNFIYKTPSPPRATELNGSASVRDQPYGLEFNSSVEPLMIFSTGTAIRGYWMRGRIYFDIVTRTKSRTTAATQPTSITDAFSMLFDIFSADSRAPTGSSQAGSGKAKTPAEEQKPENTIVGLDMDPNSKEVFWVELGKEPGVYSTVVEDEQFEARHRRRYRGTKKVVEYGLLSPEDIALDTVAKNAYITDAGLPAIVVCSYVHVHCKIIQQDKIHKPRAIIADSARGWIMFTDWGDQPGIYLQSMDGRRFETLIDTDVIWPNGLAADQTSNQLYWADARLNKIEQVDLVTRQRRTIIKETNTNPFSVSLFENRIYWSDWSKNEIKTCNKLTGNGTRVLMHADDIYGIHIYHPDLHKDDASNPCWSKHCSHLCLLSPGGTTYAAARRVSSPALGANCACPDSMVLDSIDKATCYEANSAFLLINVRNYVAQVFPDRIGLGAVEEIVYSREHAIQDIAADWQRFRLFFFDAVRRIIYSGDFSDHEPVFTNFTGIQSKSIRGLLFDHASDNLYWLDPDAGTLTMRSTRGDLQRVLRRQLDHPTSMVLDSQNRVFYIACLGLKPQIMRLDVTGSEQTQLTIMNQTIREGMGLPVALHLDEREQRLYWADAQLETIESIGLDVKSRTSGIRANSRLIHKRHLGTILSFVIYHDYFIWTVQNDGFLYKSKIVAKKNSRPTMFKLPPNPLRGHLSSDYKRLIHVDPFTTGSTSACHTTSCSHGCILDSSHTAKCVCPDNFKLSLVNRTNCIEQGREETIPLPPATNKLIQANTHAASSSSAAAQSTSTSLHNIIAHLDDLGPTGERPKSSASAPSGAHRMSAFESHHEQGSSPAAMMSHEQLVPLMFHNQQEQQATVSSGEGGQDGTKHEGNRVVWLIIFLLILSAGAVVTAVSLMILHRQGRLPRQVSVSFISPSTSLGGSRASDKDRAMLLLDTDN